MHHELVVLDDADDVAGAGADRLARIIRDAVSARGECHAAVSGGKTPWAMFTLLAEVDLPWASITLYQVDERVAPDGDPDRNLTHLRACLAGRPVNLVAMDVGASDVDAAAAAYAAKLPEVFDVVHLGLGPDGHTASLVPGDAVLDVTDRLVAVTAPYQGHPRMTLTYPALARATRLLWLVAGADKHDALSRLVDGDTSMPAGRVTSPSSEILCDRAAA